MSAVEDKECVRGAKGVGREEAKAEQSGRGLMESFAYKVKQIQSKDRFPLKTPAGNDKGNLVLFISSYIRYRMLKNVTHQNTSVLRFMCLSFLFMMCLKATFQKRTGVLCGSYVY